MRDRDLMVLALGGIGLVLWNLRRADQRVAMAAANVDRLGRNLLATHIDVGAVKVAVNRIRDELDRGG